MLRLMMMRHAKSSWKKPELEDHQRPLSKRGRKDAPRVAARLAELGWSPQLVVSSDSRRTLETWGHMEATFPEAQVRFTPELYLSGAQAVTAELIGLPSDIERVLLLGHNPGWEDALEQLTGHRHRLTTANVALLESDQADWSAALRSPWTLVSVIRPKEL